MTPTLQAYVLRLHQDTRRGLLDHADALGNLTTVTGNPALAERLLDQAPALLATLTVQLLHRALWRWLSTAMDANPLLVLTVRTYLCARAERAAANSTKG